MVYETEDVRLNEFRFLLGFIVTRPERARKEKRLQG
jgi:hypothetical protein